MCSSLRMDDVLDSEIGRSNGEGLSFINITIKVRHLRYYMRYLVH